MFKGPLAHYLFNKYLVIVHVPQGKNPERDQ